MKKKLIVLTLSLGLLVIGASSAFADGEEFYGHGNSLYNSDLTIEERHELKIAQIDQLVKDGKITAEKGEEYKVLIAERQSTCDGLGSNRDTHERLGIGFGNADADGTGSRLGRGHRGGYRNQ